MTKYILLILYSLFVLEGVVAQQDSVIVLQEVILSDSKLQQFSNGLSLTKLSDSIVRRNKGMLTDNLQFVSPIYFKQNGYGMVSSASFRGTSAQQTAVVWNGININSQLTGQTDFNSLMPQNLDGVTIRSGGGSTQYGTGAIGGSIHLNQNLIFDKLNENQLNLGYGSFNTSTLFFKSSIGSSDYSLNIGLGHFSSSNDYKYLGTERKNENGAFSNQNLDIAFGWRLNNANFIKLFHNTFIGDRDFSATLTAPSNDNYRDLNSRSLVEWAHVKTKTTQKVKVAYLTERYRYYQNKASSEFSFGKSKSTLINYDYLYRTNKWKLNGILEANTVRAEGSSIEKETRNRLATILLLSHSVLESFSYGIEIRKDWVNDYKSPLVFALNVMAAPVEDYAVNLNVSTNFRIPTFNDLYWKGAGASGNFELVPESSAQAGIDQSFSFSDLFNISLNGFYITTKDLIQWRPNESGNWTPINIQNVHQYGFEFNTRLYQNFQNSSWRWNNGYAFTKAIDNESDNQLLYVPLHKLTSNLSFKYFRFGTFIQGLYNGEVFTTTDNSQRLEGYLVLNIGVTYSLPKWNDIEIETELKLNNVVNENYQNVAFRPMPNRNIHLNLNFKF